MVSHISSTIPLSHTPNQLAHSYANTSVDNLRVFIVHMGDTIHLVSPKEDCMTKFFFNSVANVPIPWQFGSLAMGQCRCDDGFVSIPLQTFVKGF